jgi:hypothetical protein
MSAPYVRLHLFFATDNDKAVILRQGPSKHYRMILWHRDSDTFEDGQWIKQRIYLDWCDLSPDGEHFIYFTLNGHWSDESKGAYSVISRPPYFTALSLFPEGSTWGGGGRFIDKTRYFATGGKDIRGLAKGLSRLQRKSPTADNPSGLWTIKGVPAKLTEREKARALSPISPSMNLVLDRYDTLGGKLFRRSGEELELIRDFTDMTFEPVRAPYDARDARGADDAPKPWHPLDGEGGA